MQLNNKFKPFSGKLITTKNGVKRDVIKFSNNHTSEYYPAYELLDYNVTTIRDKQPEEQVTLRHEYSSNNIETTYGPTNMNRGRNSFIAKAPTRIDVTVGDLVMGPIDIWINLSGELVSVSSRDGNTKPYHSLLNPELKGLRKQGSILLFRIETFTTPTYDGTIGSFCEYVRERLETLTRMGISGSSYIATCYKFLYDELLGGEEVLEALEEGTKVSSNISVVSVMEFTPSDVERMRGAEDCYISEIGASIRISSTEMVGLSPYFTQPKDSNTLLEDLLNNPMCSLMVNDHNGVSSPRYVGIPGGVYEIPKRSLLDLEEGLWMMYSGDKKIVKDRLMSLDEFLEDKRYFRTREEAMIGIDKVTEVQVKRDIVVAENAIKQSELTTNAKAVEAEVKQESVIIDKLFKEMEALRKQVNEREEYLETRRNFDRSSERSVRDFELEMYKYERDRARMATKDYYDDRSYRRSDTSDMWKFGLAAAAAVLGTITLVNKFSK